MAIKQTLSCTKIDGGAIDSTVMGKGGNLDTFSPVEAMVESDPTISVVDDDEVFGASLGQLLRSAGFDARIFSCVADFLKSECPNGPTCLVLDVRLPGQSGLGFL